MSNSNSSFYPPEYVAANKEQAARLKPEAAELGLQLDTYLTSDVAEWVLAQVESGTFMTPSDAVLAAMQALMELQKSPDLHQELFSREIQRSFDAPRPSIPGDEALANVLERIKAVRGRTPPTWVKVLFPE
ncbi:hypothetical protein [Agrobacterium tumefaciens]|uniref:Uncharacterized protein n=1 Tax=Agrobacterium tumefaciens TaxID=358 RepID=A0AA44F949_AGRTU|nr:hypothetical protein [Agrobacterium tumefaciens]NSL25121.1 hypothetical protein [Agrobacterium tumefaciens]NTB86774.1 hypothetical protein [Agrobacterium tumefaciens]NTC21103.1 hypothetical protein [Agrobacterium tumefaciens]NTC30651.1 hypothetical protein [Agrobacterium tumefaciens]NTC57687.1 hypothetical protein [Agrobacterium tumefaciens]